MIFLKKLVYKAFKIIFYFLFLHSPAKIEAPAATETPAKVEKKSESTDNITIKKWTDEERAAARAARFAANAEDRFVNSLSLVPFLAQNSLGGIQYLR